MSLTARLLLLVLGLVALVLLGLGLYLGGAVAQWSLQAQDEELERRADAIAAAVKVERSGELELEDEAGEHEGGLPFRVETLEGVVLFQTGFDWPALGAERGAVTRQTRSGAELRIFSRPFVPEHAERLGDGQRELLLRVAAPTAALSALATRFRVGLAVALAAGLLLGGLGALVIARTFLAPVHRLSAEAATIEERSLSRRLTTVRLAPELGRLAGAFNAVLDRLEAAFGRQQQFVARASHSLRTPLASILAQAEVSLRRERSPEEYREALATIAQAAREAAALSTGLLALSRADASAAALQKEPVRLGELVEELRRLFGARLEAAGVALEVDLDPSLVLAADRARLRELLEALLDNAITWTPRGGRVGVRSRVAGPEVELDVWDTGPGIPIEERPHLFERFFRGAAAAQHHAPGSGLGLAIVEAIAQAHGGSVAVADNPGGGAQLRVRLPA